MVKNLREADKLPAAFEGENESNWTHEIEILTSVAATDLRGSLSVPATLPV